MVAGIANRLGLCRAILRKLSPEIEFTDPRAARGLAEGVYSICVKRPEQQQDRNDMNRILRARYNRKATVTSLARCLVGGRALPMPCNSARLAWAPQVALPRLVVDQLWKLGPFSAMALKENTCIPVFRQPRAPTYRIRPC